MARADARGRPAFYAHPKFLFNALSSPLVVNTQPGTGMLCVHVSADLQQFGARFELSKTADSRFGKYNASKVIDTLVLQRVEYLVTMRADELNGVVVGVQFVTNTGRRTKWATALSEARLIRCSRLVQTAPAGEMIVGVNSNGMIETAKAPSSLAHHRGPLRAIASYTSLVVWHHSREHPRLLFSTMKMGLLSKVLRKVSVACLSNNKKRPALNNPMRIERNPKSSRACSTC